MSERSIEKLAPEFRKKAIAIKEETKRNDVDILIYCTLRTCREQARLYRSTRPWSEIEQKICQLREDGFPFLADILLSVGPQYGPMDRHITWAAPGESWHNYGMAFDAVPLVNGKPDWAMDYSEKWTIYGNIVTANGCQWAGEWPLPKREFVHVQIIEPGNPLENHTPRWLEKALTQAGAL